MKNYFFGKLFDINYHIAIHEGDANRRLASEAVKILFQLNSSKDLVPSRYKAEFNKLVVLIKETIESLSQQGLIPIKIKGIQNRTAAKYIKLLIDIQENLRENSI